MSDGRHCKTCAHLQRYDIPDYNDYGYRCGWRDTLARGDFPWAEAMLAATTMTNCRSGIGKRHVEGDWAEVMDCAKWERKATKT